MAAEQQRTPAEQKKRPRFTEGKTSPSIQAMIFSPRVATAIVKVKQEPEDWMAEQVVTGLNAKKKWLHCAACPAPLEPPIFKCEGGHVVCCACGGGGGNTHCVACACAEAATYTHLPHMDGLIAALELPCPHTRFGCGASVAYHAVAEHKATCALAPCYCLQCAPPFEGTPAGLVRHLTDQSGHHRWPAPEMIEYGTEHSFVLPASSGDHRRLLVAEEDGGVFLLAVGDCRGVAGVRPFNVVCVRGKDGARPVYKGTVKVKGPPDEDGDVLGFVVYGKMASCAMPAEVDMEQGRLHAHVNPAMLHGDSKELHLAICIEHFP